MTTDIGFNALTVGLLAIFLAFLYLLGLILRNTITVMGPKDFGKFAMFIGLIAWMLPWMIMGNIVQTLIALAVIIILLFILVVNKYLKNSNSKSSAAAAGKGGH